MEECETVTVCLQLNNLSLSRFLELSQHPQTNKQKKRFKTATHEPLFHKPSDHETNTFPLR